MTVHHLTKQDRLDRAASAKRLLDDPVLQEAFDWLEDAMVEQMLQRPSGDDVGRYRLSVGVGVVRKVRGYLRDTVATGDLAKREKPDLA